MTWFRVDDALSAHPKTRRAGLAAMGLWTVAGSWSSQQLTEGFVPDWFVATWPQGKTLAARLVLAGFWDPAEDGDEQGWQFHDWCDANPTAASEKERRRKARDRQRKLRERSAAKREAALDKALEDDASPSTSRVTYDVSNGAPTRPVPTRPDLSTDMSFRGGSHVSSGSPAAPPLFPDHCQQHATDPTPGKCGDCKDQRKANEAKPRLSLVGPANPATVPHCGKCDETRHLTTPVGVIRCPVCHPLALEASA